MNRNEEYINLKKTIDNNKHDLPLSLQEIKFIEFKKNIGGKKIFLKENNLEPFSITSYTKNVTKFL